MRPDGSVYIDSEEVGLNEQVGSAGAGFRCVRAGGTMARTMDQRRARDILSGRTRGPGAGLLRAALRAAAVPYAAAMRVRRWAYRAGLLPARTADVPVICVGNVTTGGTGKTPMVAWVVRRLAQAGRRPAILMRGYKPAAGVCDEARLLERLCDAPVVVKADRGAGAAAAAADGADVCVMDDGFQHLRLRRDLDIVLVDATNPFGYGRCLPRGLLREPVSALAEADAVVISRGDRLEAQALGALRARLARLAGRASLHVGVHRPTKIIDEGGGERPLAELAGRRVCAFCGIGNPREFFATLQRLGAELTSAVALNDHVRYRPEVIAALRRAAEESGCELLATTEKDYVKLPRDAFGPAVWQLAVEMAIVEGQDELAEKVLAAAQRRPSPEPGGAA